MSRYALYNGDLGALLGSDEPRPKLRLILRAHAKTRGKSRFVEDFVALYRQVGEGGLRLSPAQQAVLEKIATS
jgi:hypothetical protein